MQRNVVLMHVPGLSWTGDALQHQKEENMQPQLHLAANSSLFQILEELTSKERADQLLRVVVVPRPLLDESGDVVSRALLAQALNMLLFEDLLERVPAALRYAMRALAEGKSILHDHGAVRTILQESMGALPAGQEAILRILRPLGYALYGVYPLERLHMTGRSYAQVDMPEEIAQFFLSELHPETFSSEFQDAVRRVTEDSIDPLTPEAVAMLSTLERDGRLPRSTATTLLPALVRCFARHHQDVTEADYDVLLAESAEMAWIATEGNVLNHVTDRVADVDRLSDVQKALGEPMKPTVETSQSRRVRQTAFLAARVQRTFRAADGTLTTREVPGSFLEFITRLPMPADSPEAGRLDLGFDSSNAQAIFKMTAGKPA